MDQELPQFVVIPQPQRNKWLISSEAFWDRFSLNERADLLIACVIDTTKSQAIQRAAAKRLMRKQDIDAAGTINLKNNKIEAFVKGLEADSILQAGRADIILTTPVANAE